MTHKCPSPLSQASGLPEAIPDEGISEGNKVCPIKVIKSNCIVCLSADINGLISQMGLIQSLRLVHLSVSEVIYTNGWIHFSCCSAPLVLFFLASLSRSILFLPVQVSRSALLLCLLPFSITCGEDDILLQPPRRPLSVL